MAAEQKQEQVPDHIILPAPTAWPFVTAFGLTFLAAGVVTQAAFSLVGLILAVRGAVGWFRDVLPVKRTSWCAFARWNSGPALSCRLPAQCNTFDPGSQATVFVFPRKSILIRRDHGRYSWRDCDGDCCLPLWCDCAPQHLVSD